MKFKAYPLEHIDRLLEPGPVVMVTTAKGEKQNIMTMAWHTMMEFTPPLVGCVISNRDYTFSLIAKTKECVLAIPTRDIAATVVKVGNNSGEHMNKFKKFGLTPLPAAVVRAPLVAEAYANLECRVVDSAWANKYNFFVLQVIKAWINPAVKQPKTIHHYGTGHFIVDGPTIKFPWKLK